MHKIIIVSNCKNKSLKKTSLILDKFAVRISHRTWETIISQKLLDYLINMLNSSASKNTSIGFFKKNKLIYNIGNYKTPFPVKKRKTTKSNLLLELAAELHDIGKATFQFQEYLNTQNTDIYDIRHEYMSLLILEWLFLNINSDTITKKDFLSYLQNRIKSSDFISKNIQNDNIRKLLFLVATHHRLPAFDPEIGKITNQSFEHKAAYIRHNDVNIENMKILLPLPKLLKIQKQLIQLSKKTPISDFLFFKYRISLLLGDHVGSSFKFNKEYKDSYIHAKTKDNNYQTLTNHTKIVRYFSKKMFDLINNNELFSTYLDIDLQEKIHKKSPEKFKWQDDSLDFISKNYSDKPILTFLTSSTGSGKTYYSLKQNIFTSSKKRLTVLNGLRSLTYQTGQAYKEFNLFSENDMSVLIGNIHILKKMNNIVEDSLDNNKIDFELSNVRPYGNRYKEFFSNYLNNKEVAFLDTPVLISTIDFVIKSIDFRRSNFLLPLLRIISTDLIIDEVDEFSPEDQQSIIKLLYICGLFNVNVTLSTATLIPALAESFYNAYNKGIEDSNKNSDFDCFYISDSINFKQKKEEDFKTFLLNASIENIKNINPKNTIEIRNITKQNALSHILELHDNEHETFEDKEYSISLFRIANIKNAVEIANYLEKDIEELDKDIYDIDIILYHSQFPLIRRFKIEKELDSLLKRKTEKLYEKKLFKKKNKKKNIIIVIATSVEEVGKDHDFDTNIIEPSSSRSITQNSGRVFRHRNRNSDKVNIFIMNENFKLQENRKIVYTKPGYETETISFVKDNEKKIEYLIKDLEFAGTNKNILVLDKEKQYLSYLENKSIENSLSLINKNLSIDNLFLANNLNKDKIGHYTSWRKGKSFSGHITINKELYLNELGNYERFEYLSEKNSLINKLVFEDFKEFFIETKQILSEKILNSVSIPVYKDMFKVIYSENKGFLIL